ncbi:unnamed protein product [Lactuca virosa]|uniref:Isopropylmalate dehydrogenase-like domain-containing protein n=1 Tax=Lactuca virosa TaxID=75947 RepID=A0AAU9MXW3_9ASTR|nr:unnamed protein product [Lactuca virosa]
MRYSQPLHPTNRLFSPTDRSYSSSSSDLIRATLFPGDGIGPEIATSVKQIFNVAEVPIDWEEHYVGTEVDPRTQSFVTWESLESVRRNKVELKGPMATPIGKEGEYSGLEHQVVKGVVESLKIITRHASLRVAEYAFHMLKLMRKEVHRWECQKNQSIKSEAYGKCIKSKAYGDAVRFYTGAMPIFKAYRDSSLQDCKKASEEVIPVIINKLQDWLSRATNWAKFSATAGLGVIHGGHLQQGRPLMAPYLPQSGAGGGGGGGSPYSEGAALYALGVGEEGQGESYFDGKISFFCFKFYAVLLIEKKDEEGQSHVLSAALEIAEGETSEVDAKYRALVAIGSLPSSAGRRLVISSDGVWDALSGGQQPSTVHQVMTN